MESNKTLWAALIAVAIIAVGAYFYPHVASNLLGGVTNYDEVDTSALRVGGTNSTRLGLLSFGTCSLIAGSYTVAATTTVAMDCAITGIVATDGFFAQFATSSQSLAGGWSVRGASASSTAGFATISVVNGTGASSVIPASIASSTKYILLRQSSSIPGL